MSTGDGIAVAVGVGMGSAVAVGVGEAVEVATGVGVGLTSGMEADRGSSLQAASETAATRHTSPPPPIRNPARMLNMASSKAAPFFGASGGIIGIAEVWAPSKTCT